MMATWQHWMVGQIDASIAAAVVLAVALAGRHRLSPVVRSAILLVALVRLVLPPWLRSPWSEALVDLPPLDDTRLVAAGWLDAGVTAPLWLIITAISIVVLGRLAYQSWHMSRSLQWLDPAPPAWQEKVNRLAPGAGIDVRVSTADGPFATGLFRQFIVVPAALIDRLDAGAIDAVLAHEVAHHLRRDLWWLAAARVLAGVVWFNPLAHLIVRALAATREDGSDDWAVTRTSRDPFTYAHALLQSARMVAVPHPAGTAGAHPMGPRLRRLLDGGAGRDSRLTPAGGALILIAAAFALPGAHMPSLDSPDQHDDATIVIERVLGERRINVIRNR